MSFLDKFKETSKNKKILIAVIAVLIVGGGTTVGILVHNNSDKPSKAEVSSVDDNITAEVDDIIENEKTSSDDEAELLIMKLKTSLLQPPLPRSPVKTRRQK